jgi:hypothetical protein
MIFNRSALIGLIAVFFVWAGLAGGLAAQTTPEPPAQLPAVPGITAPPAPLGLTPAPGAVPQVTLPPTQRPLDLVVTITMANGTSETFSREIHLMEVITLPDGRIEMVHLVLVSGGERNTHVWYNYSRVAKLGYRFITGEGRNKVHMRVVHPTAPTRELTDQVEPLSPRDFR